MNGTTLRKLGVALAAALGLIVSGALPAYGQLKIVTVTPTYEAIARDLGGPHVRVESLMRGPENIHRIVPTPSKMLAIRDADMLIHSGLDCEPWVPILLRGSRNREIQPGQPGNVNCARGITLKNVPQIVSRAEGDLHVYGNPHYQTEPVNLILIARTIRDALKQHDPANAAHYDQQYAQFEEKMKKKLVEYLTKMRPYRGAKVVGYHDCISYFVDRFGLVLVGMIEPKPGLEPSPGHTAELVTQMRETGCKVMLVNTWANEATVRGIAERAGAKVVVFPGSVNGVEGVDDVFAYMDYLVDNVAKALSEVTPAGS
jgi:zinc/manganese transport system substrate-binding protein